MNTKFPFKSDAVDRLVYVRPVQVADLPKDLREQAEGLNEIYAVHNADGERLALVKERQMAFWLAREHDLSAQNVH